MPPKKPTIDDAARAQIRDAIAVYGPEYECLFEAHWDESAQVITSARLVTRGSRDAVQMLAGCFAPGSIHLHSHPEGAWVEPSSADLETAARMAMIGCGSAICSPSAGALFLICSPLTIRPFAPPAPDRKLIFKAGRFSLFHWTEQRFFQIILTH